MAAFWLLMASAYASMNDSSGSRGIQSHVCICRLTGGQFAGLDSPNETGSPRKAVCADCMPFDTSQNGDCWDAHLIAKNGRESLASKRFSRQQGDLFHHGRKRTVANVSFAGTVTLG
jgi:hypothetical protein